MKTLYWNGVSDVQISKVGKKWNKRIGIANIRNVFHARKEGNIRVIRMSCGGNVGIKNDVWQEFISLHNDQDSKNLAEQQGINFFEVLRAS